MRFHDAFSISLGRQALQPLALVVVSVCDFRFVAYSRACGTIIFVLFSAMILTLLLPFPLTKRPHCRKNSILAKVCFGAKRG